MNSTKLDLQHDLTDAFIQYQWNLDNPFPNFPSQEELLLKYRSDYMFHAKVNQLVAGVMVIVQKHYKD